MEIYINQRRPCYQGNDKEIVSEEKGCKHVGINDQSHEIRQFHVDGDIIKSGTEESRCDYLVVNDTAKRAYFIELKRSHVKKATRQIDAIIPMVKDLKGYATFCRIVYRGHHDLTNTERIRWENKYHGRAKIGRTPFRESICHDK